jgi:hypothetical protein
LEEPARVFCEMRACQDFSGGCPESFWSSSVPATTFSADSNPKTSFNFSARSAFLVRDVLDLEVDLDETEALDIDEDGDSVFSAPSNWRSQVSGPAP